MKIELLIGMIASGKSTYCKMRSLEGALIVNDDSIVNAVHSDIYLAYDKKLKPLYKGIENLIIHFAVAHGRDIVIDRPNMDPRVRARYIEIARSLDIPEIVGVLFKIETPAIHAFRRTTSDARGFSYGMWLEAANYHYSRYKEPSLDEGFTEIMSYGIK